MIEKWPFGYVDIVTWAEPFIEIFGGLLAVIGIFVTRQWDRVRWIKSVAAILIVAGSVTYNYHHLSETGKIDDWLDRITQEDSAPGLVKQQIPTLAGTLQSIDSYLVEESVLASAASTGERPDPGPSLFSDFTVAAQNENTETVRIGRSYLVGAQGQPIILTNNPIAKNPSWQQLTTFLKSDRTDQRRYDLGLFVCADFAQMLHNNAEKAGWRAAYVAIQLGPSPDNPTAAGHALNAFETTDRGLVFIDSTGVQSASGPSNADKVVVVVEGKNYIPQSIFPEPGWSVTWGNMGRVLAIEVVKW